VFVWAPPSSGRTGGTTTDPITSRESLLGRLGRVFGTHRFLGVVAEKRARVGATVVKTLFAISGNNCYFTGCDEKMALREWQRANGEIRPHPGRNALAQHATTRTGP